MADPLFWNLKSILCKTEAVYGTDPTPTGEANGMLVVDAQISPMEGEETSRELELPYMGAQGSIVVALRAVFTGSIELATSGQNGVAPAWSPLIRACAIDEDVTAESGPEEGDGSVVYTPISTNHESVTIYFYVDDVLHALVGARGTGEMTIEASGVPRFRFTVTGLWVQPTDAARPVAKIGAFETPFAASTANTPAFTIDEEPFVLRRFNLNFGNDVQPRLLIGREQILIVDRQEAIQATVEATPLATFNPYELARTKQRVPLAITHTDTAGGSLAFAAPACEVGRLTGYENQQNIAEWPLALTPMPTAGDDQWSLTLT